MSKLTPERFTLAQKAVVEHNIVAVGRIYTNIYISELAHLLHLEPEVAEKVSTTTRLLVIHEFEYLGGV